MSGRVGRMEGWKAKAARAPWAGPGEGPPAEVRPRHKHRRARVLRPVQHEIAARAPVIEKEGAVARPLDALQELLGDDLVRVDVGEVERRHASGDVLNGLHHRFRTVGVSEANGDTKLRAVGVSEAESRRAIRGAPARRRGGP